jgi:hypothetical protein
MRFKEDYAYSRANGYVLVRVECDAATRATRLLNRGEVKNQTELELLEVDRTETDLDEMDFDIVLTNDRADVEAFVENALKVIQRHLGER